MTYRAPAEFFAHVVLLEYEVVGGGQLPHFDDVEDVFVIMHHPLATPVMHDLVQAVLGGGQVGEGGANLPHQIAGYHVHLQE